MNNEIIKEIKIVGITCRTSNANLMDIESLWKRFFNENISGKIINKVSDDIYAVYSDYQSDYTGLFNLTIGFAVDSVNHIPEGCVEVNINPGLYSKFISKGVMPQAVINTWKEIWNSDLNRLYGTDFTIHGKKYYNGDDSEVETFISIKSQ